MKFNLEVNWNLLRNWKGSEKTSWNSSADWVWINLLSKHNCCIKLSAKLEKCFLLQSDFRNFQFSVEFSLTICKLKLSIKVCEHLIKWSEIFRASEFFGEIFSKLSWLFPCFHALVITNFVKVEKMCRKFSPNFETHRKHV